MEERIKKLEVEMATLGNIKELVAVVEKVKEEKARAEA